MTTPKEIPAGTSIHVGVPAQVVRLESPDNPYYYRVRYPSGEEDVVSIARITRLSDRGRGILDTADGSVEIPYRKLSATGAIDLFHWLRCNLPELTALTTPEGDEESEATP